MAKTETFTEQEAESYLRKSIALSRTHMESGAGGPFGAIIVRDKKIIGEGWNQVTSTCDPTAHAEMVAIREACKAVQDFSLEGATIFTSCEPCPMCLAGIYWSRLSKVYYANSRKDAAAIEFDDEFLYQEIGKEIPERRLPMEQKLRGEAQAVFKDWQNKVDKTPY